MSTFAALAIEETAVFALAAIATIWMRTHLARTSRQVQQEQSE
jgi:hypothetical protein